MGGFPAVCGLVVGLLMPWFRSSESLSIRLRYVGISTLVSIGYLANVHHPSQPFKSLQIQCMRYTANVGHCNQADGQVVQYYRCILHMGCIFNELRSLGAGRERLRELNLAGLRESTKIEPCDESCGSTACDAIRNRSAMMVGCHVALGGR
jgi:hypothetical protein